MNVSDVISELNDHGFEDTAEARKVAHINAAYFDVINRFPWPFLKTETSASTASGTGLVSLPADFGRPLYLRANDRTLPEVTVEEFQRKFGRNQFATTGAARLYYQLNGALYVWPRPTGTGNLPLGYVKRASSLTAATVEANILIPASYHRLLVTGALQRLYRMEDDPELSMAFKTEFEEQVNNMATDYMVHPVETPQMGGTASDSGSDSRSGS